MDQVPDIVTHNYDPDRGPFRNLCALPLAEAERVLDEVRASGTRRIKPNYLKRRIATERWLKSERSRILGSTRLPRPVYFFLGDFADGLDPSRAQSFQMPLSAFSPEMVTFTYPDSMASLSLATRAEHVGDRKPYHGHVFTLDEIGEVIAEHGMPAKCGQIERSKRYDRFVEVQVWDDRPIARFWAQAGQRQGLLRLVAPPFRNASSSSTW